MWMGLAAGLVGVAMAAQPAGAVTFSFSILGGDTLSNDQSAAFQMAANAWSAVLADPIAVTLKIGFRNLGSGILGETTPTLVSLDANTTRGLLAADARSATDAAAVASLPPYAVGTRLLLTSAEARAIGATTSAGADASIEFSSSFTFSTSRNAQGQVAAGTYDLIGIAEHEIGHALGFVSDVDYRTGYPSLMDQFRFSGTAVRSETAGASAYFSLDDGTTSVAAFSPGGSGNYQASHWLQGTGGLMDPAIATGVTQTITALDLNAFDALGYDLITAVPEPGSALLLLVGVLGLGVVRRAATARTA